MLFQLKDGRRHGEVRRSVLCGSSIHRYEIKPESFVPPDHSDSSMEVICAHFDKHVGPAETVLHEIISSRVHLDVHIVRPNAQWQHILLYTTGMSDLPMTVPEGAEEFRFAELAMVLPSNWPLSDAKFKDERNYWPVRWLKTLARFPHDYDTWLSYGHTMPNGDPPEPLPITRSYAGSCLRCLTSCRPRPLWCGHVRAKRFASGCPCRSMAMKWITN